MFAELDVAVLSGIQFASTIAFHIIFPTLTIGLALFLVEVEAAWLRTGEEVYFRLYRFWAKIFALSFGMGVVSGIVLLRYTCRVTRTARPPLPLDCA